VIPGLDEELTKRLGPDADHMHRWAQGAQARLEYADWEDRGNTAARVIAVYAERAGFSGKVIMKYVPKRHKETEEAGRLSDAWDSSPFDFRTQHLVRHVWDPQPVGNQGWVLFQEVAGRSLTRTRSLATLLGGIMPLASGGSAAADAAETAEAAAIMVAAALGEWNANGVTQTRPTATKHLRNLLGDRLARGKPLRTWAEQRELLTGSGSAPEPTPLRLAGRPNPLALVLGSHPAAQQRVYVRCGLAHGDLHPGNVMFDEDLTEFWFIDLSRFGKSRPLAFDPAYLLLTITARILPSLHDDVRSQAIDLLLAPPGVARSRLRSRLWLPEQFGLLIDAIQVAGEEWAAQSSVVDEWHQEILLSFVACGLIMASRLPVHDQGGEWFLELSTAAADQYVELQKLAGATIVDAEPTSATSTVRSAAPPSSPAPLMTGPAPLPYAVSRSSLRKILRTRHVDRPGSLVALHGPPGSGKSQLAVEYFHSYGAEYAGATWLSGDTPELLSEQFRYMAGELNVSPGRDIDALLQLVTAAMRERGRWLLVFDNVSTGAVIRPFLPQAAHVDVLVTSRNQHWTQLGITLEVGGFERRESLAILTSVLGDQTGLGELAAALHDLPAAVAQAAHFLSGAPITIERFRKIVLTRTREALEHGATDAYGMALATVWEEALDQLATTSPEAGELVTLSAFFGPAPVPFDLLAAAVANHTTVPVDELTLVDKTGPATSSGMVSVSTNALCCYPLLQAFVRERTGADATRYRQAVRAGLAGDPGDPREPRHWPRFHQLLPHALAVDLADADGVAERRLLLSITRYLVARGDLGTSLELARDALARWRQRLGDGDGDELVLEAMTHLAHTHFQRGEYSDATRLDEEVLARQRARFGADGAETLIAARDLAASRAAARRHEADPGLVSEPSSEPIAERQREMLGADHPDTLRSMINLAHELRASGHRLRAREVAADTHRRLVAVLGARHLDTLLCAHGLGLDLRDCGEHEAARRLDEEVYAARRELLGTDHPDTAQSAVSLATDLRRVAKFAQASELDAAAYATLARVLGADHQLTLLAAHGLAADHERLGELDEAVSLAEDTYTRRRHMLGPHDLATSRSANLLARLHEARGHPELAAPLRAALSHLRIMPPA
jgi:tetratricopeptide repeat protein/NB-ARC domain-containing protein